MHLTDAGPVAYPMREDGSGKIIEVTPADIGKANEKAGDKGRQIQVLWRHRCRCYRLHEQLRKVGVTATYVRKRGVLDPGPGVSEIKSGPKGPTWLRGEDMPEHDTPWEQVPKKLQKHLEVITRLDLVNATGWDRSRIQKGFRDTLLRLRERAEAEMEVEETKSESHLRSDVRLAELRKQVAELSRALRLLRKVVTWEIGGTATDYEVGEKGYSPAAALRNLRHVLRDHPDLALYPDVGSVVEARFFAFATNSLVEKANTEWERFVKPALAMMGVLRDAGIETIRAFRKGHSFRVAQLFGPHSPAVFEHMMEVIAGELRTGVDMKEAARRQRALLDWSVVVGEALEEWGEIRARRTERFNTLHGYEPKHLRWFRDSCYEDTMRLEKFRQDRAKHGPYDEATNAMANLVADVMPKLDRRLVESFEQAIRQAQDNPPEDKEAKATFVEAANRFMELFNLRVAIDGDSGKHLYRFRMAPGSTGNGYIQLVGGKTRMGSRGFRKGDLRVVEVEREDSPGGKLARVTKEATPAHEVT